MFSFLEPLHRLQGRKVDEEGPSATSHYSQGHKSSRAAQHECSENQLGTKNRYIEVRLAPVRVAALLDAAPNPEVRTGWENGSAVSDAPHRLRLVESRAAKKHYSHLYGTEGYNQDIGVFRRESRQWWEERAEECAGRRGADGGGGSMA